MKKLFLLALGFVALTVLPGYAGNADLFSYDKSSLDTEMAQINELEAYVMQNQDVSLSDLQSSGNQLATAVNRTNTMNSLQMLNDKALGIPSFLWGCCLGPVGILVVYLVADDSSETKKSIWGCIVGSILQGGSWYFYQFRYLPR